MSSSAHRAIHGPSEPMRGRLLGCTVVGITDPGYQQFGYGEERIYSIGPQAHSFPREQRRGAKRAPRWWRTSNRSPARPSGRTSNSTKCYRKHPAGARVQRTVSLTAPASSARRVSVARTRRRNPPHWLGGTHMAWAFVDGWARRATASTRCGSARPATRSRPRRKSDIPAPAPAHARAQRAAARGQRRLRWWVIHCDQAAVGGPPSCSVECIRGRHPAAAKPVKNSREVGRDVPTTGSRVIRDGSAGTPRPFFRRLPLTRGPLRRRRAPESQARPRAASRPRRRGAPVFSFSRTSDELIAGHRGPTTVHDQSRHGRADTSGWPVDRAR